MHGVCLSRGESVKRSAVATVLNGRRRRQPAPALGKAVASYAGVGKQAVRRSHNAFLSVLASLSCLNTPSSFSSWHLLSKILPMDSYHAQRRRREASNLVSFSLSITPNYNVGGTRLASY